VPPRIIAPQPQKNAPTSHPLKDGKPAKPSLQSDVDTAGKPPVPVPVNYTLPSIDLLADEKTLKLKALTKIIWQTRSC